MVIRVITILILFSIVFAGGLTTGGIKLGDHPNPECVKGTPTFVRWEDFKHFGSLDLRWPVFREKCKFDYYPDTKELIPTSN